MDTQGENQGDYNENNDNGNPPQGMDPKVVSIIAYLTIVGTIIALILNNQHRSEFASFHVRQGLGLGLTGFVLSFINIIPILGWLIFLVGGIILFILWVIGILGAINNEEKVVPLVGDKFQEWFKGI